MEYEELFKIILENGFTPEIRKELEERAYSSKDIADLIQVIAKDKADHAEIKKKLEGIEARLGEKKVDAEYITKDSLTYKTGKALVETPAEIISGIKENPSLTAGVIGVGLLTAAGVYVGSYLAVSEIGGAIGGVIPLIFCNAWKTLTENNISNYELRQNIGKISLTGTIFGAISGIAAACLAYGIIPDIAPHEAMNIIGKGVLSGVAGGIIGMFASYAHTDEINAKGG